MRIKQSLCFPLFNPKDMPLADFFRDAKAIGYAAIEFWFRDKMDDYEDVIRLAPENGLAIASMCGHQSLTEGLNNPDDHDRIESELRDSIDVAAANGIPGIICFSGNRRDGQSDLEGMVECAKGLRRITPYAEEKGVNLNMELLNSRVNHPGYQCDHTDWGVALCEMVGSPRMKLLYDIYHMQIMEGDVIRKIRDNIAYIGHFHTAGNPGRKDMDDEQELNYRAICRAIAETGYEFFVGHELTPKGDRMEAARQTFEICDQG